MEIIKELTAQLQFHERQANAIRIVLEGYGVKGQASDTDSGLPANHGADGFPKNANKQQQITWLFRNVLKRGSQMIDIQNAYVKAMGGKAIQIAPFVRAMKSEKLIGKVTYNNNNNLTFWGLSDYIGDTDYLPEYYPSENALPHPGTPVVEK